MVARRLVAALLALGLVTAGPATSAPAAAAAPRCQAGDRQAPVIRTYSPRTVVLGTKPVSVRFSVKASDDCAIGGWSLDSGSLVYAYLKRPVDRLAPYANSDAGRHTMEVEAYDTAGNVALRRFDFQVLRATRWVRVDATEPARRGGTVRVTGSLERADFTRGRFVAYGAGQRVAVQFRPDGARAYRTVTTARLDAQSSVSVTLAVAGRLAQDGRYRLAYAGQGVSAASTSASDAVAFG